MIKSAKTAADLLSAYIEWKAAGGVQKKIDPQTLNQVKRFLSPIRNHPKALQVARNLLTPIIQKDVHPFPYGKVLHEGPASITIAPKDDPKTVIKIIKQYPEIRPRGLMPDEEFEMLQKLQTFKSKRCVTPVPIEHGKNPPHLRMVRLGKSFSYMSPDSEIEHIGRAFGEMGAHLWTEYGSIHDDICFNNCTKEPHGKIGIIDIASVVKADSPEEMFYTPMLSRPNIVPYMVDEFERITGQKIDLELVTKIVEDRLAGKSEVSENIKENVRLNLEECQRFRDKKEAKRRMPSYTHSQDPITEKISRTASKGFF